MLGLLNQIYPIKIKVYNGDGNSEQREPFFIRKKRKKNRKSKHCEALKAEEHEEEIHQYSQLICCLRHQNKEEGHNFIPRQFSYL